MKRFTGLAAIKKIFSLATAAGDFLVASGPGVFIKKTLADVRELLGMDNIIPVLGDNLITGWMNDSRSDFQYDTFESSGADITSAIYNNNRPEGTLMFCSSNDLTLVAGEVYKITVNLSLISGEAPELVDYHNFASGKLIAGKNVFYLSPNYTIDTLMFFNTMPSNWSATVSLQQIRTGINNTTPAYSLDLLGKLNASKGLFSGGLPSLVGGGEVGKIPVRDSVTGLIDSPIFVAAGPNLITGWSNEGYDTFESSGANITSAICLVSADTPSNSLSTIVGKIYQLLVDLTLESGENPIIQSTDGAFSQTLVNDINTIYFAFTDISSRLMITNSNPSNWSAKISLRQVGVGGVGIGTTEPDENAILDLTSTTKAFLPPRMTTVQKNAIVNPMEGMEVYDITLHKKCVYGAAGWETITSV